MHDVQMPKFGLTMKSGEINEWFVGVGDHVSSGDALCEVSSEKITNSVEAFVSGTVAEILVEEGDEAPIGEVICRIKED